MKSFVLNFQKEVKLQVDTLDDLWYLSQIIEEGDEITGKTYRKNIESLEDFCRRNDVSFLAIDTSEDYVPKLIKLFTYRNKSNPQRAR